MRPESSRTTGTDSDSHLRHVPPAVLQGWDETAGSIRQTPLPAGYSGGQVFRIDSPERGDTLAVKASRPIDHPQTSQWERRWQTLGELLTRAAAHCPALTPPFRTRQRDWGIWHQGRFWQCLPWVRGEPLPRRGDPAGIAAGGRAIAQAHLALLQAQTDMQSRSGQAIRPESGLIPPFIAPQPARQTNPAASARPDPSAPESIPRSIRQRMQRIEAIERPQHSAHGPTPGRLALAECLSRRVGGATTPLADRLLAALDWLATSDCQRRLADFKQRLRRHSQSDWSAQLQWVLRDVHREHLHFVGDTHSTTSPSKALTVAGIIDFDAIGLDHVATDLARWAGDFVNQPLSAAVAGYREIRPLSDDAVELAADLMYTGTVAALANWTDWLVWEKRKFPVDATMIQARLEHLIDSACQIC